MSAARTEAMVWVAIYLGLILMGLGLAVQRNAGNAAVLGWALAAAGLALVGVGVFLVWLRSRMKAETG